MAGQTHKTHQLRRDSHQVEIKHRRGKLPSPFICPASCWQGIFWLLSSDSSSFDIRVQSVLTISLCFFNWTRILSLLQQYWEQYCNVFNYKILQAKPILNWFKLHQLNQLFFDFKEYIKSNQSSAFGSFIGFFAELQSIAATVAVVPQQYENSVTTWFVTETN